MRVYVLTQEDAFYIPRMLDHLLAERPDVVGVGIVPGEMQPGHVQRYWKMLGTRDFLVTGVRLAAHKSLDLVARFAPLPRSYSVVGAARRNRTPFEPVPDVNAVPFVESLRARGVELLVSIACPQRMPRRAPRGTRARRDQHSRRAAPAVPGCAAVVLGAREGGAADRCHRALDG